METQDRDAHPARRALSTLKPVEVSHEALICEWQVDVELRDIPEDTLVLLVSRDRTWPEGTFPFAVQFGQGSFRRGIDRTAAGDIGQRGRQGFQSAKVPRFDDDRVAALTPTITC